MSKVPTLPTGTRYTDDETAQDMAIRPRRGLPGGRAVVGGLLVALSAIVMFWAVSAAGRPPRTRFVVASRPLAIGEAIESADLTTVALDLPRRQASHTFASVEVLLGGIVLAPIASGDLIVRSAVGIDATGGIPLVAISLAAADGLAGVLRPGDRADVFVSYGTGAESLTRLVVPAATVVDAGREGNGVGDSGSVRVVLAVRDARRRIDLVNAAHAGTVTLTRITGAPDTATRLPREERVFLETDAAGATPPAPRATDPDEAPR